MDSPRSVFRTTENIGSKFRWELFIDNLHITGGAPVDSAQEAQDQIKEFKDLVKTAVIAEPEFHQSPAADLESDTEEPDREGQITNTGADSDEKDTEE